MHSTLAIPLFVVFLIVFSDVWSTDVDEGTIICRMTKALVECDIQSAVKDMANVLSFFVVKATPKDYLLAFRAMFAVAKLKTTPTIEEDRINLEVSVEKAHFIFEFLVNRTAEEALARLEGYDNTTFFSRDDHDVFLIGMNFQHSTDTRRVVYTWIANSYSANGTLKKSFPRDSGNIVYSRSETYSVNVSMRREPFGDHYDIQELVGRGIHGSVYKCVEKRSGRIFAARFVRIWLDFQRQLIYDEINIMGELSQPTSHPNVLALHEVFNNDPDIIMVVDFLNGKLSDLMLTPEVNDCVRQICEGLKYMHSRNIAHMDVRINNVGYVMKAGSSRVVKLIDFGTAQRIGQISILKIDKIEEGYHSHDRDTPEMLENRTLGAHTDMWHLGVLTFRLLTEGYPDWGENCSEIKENIKACRWSFNDIYKELLPDKALDFLDKIFVKDIEKRMTADECLRHPWITDW